jgi:cytochrome c553
MLQQTRLVVILLVFVACSPSLPADVDAAYKTLPEVIDFSMHVKPILSDRCFSCHGPDGEKLSAGLRLDIAGAAYAELPESPGKKAIVPGSLRKSEMFRRIISTDPEYMMPEPTSHLKLTAYEKALLIKWIEQGAEYKPHWAFVKPAKPALPEVAQKAWIKNGIDHFVLHRLEKEKLSQSPEADKETLLRRVSLDLTGLPPTLQEVDAFVNDNSPNAYEKQVDRLLASPHYGEKMGVDWLDVARYADSHGYTVDRLRDMSPWRDWVIDAFNKNLSYKDFIIWQLAGDLLPNPTKEQLIATAFNRNHQQNMEGGIVEEEFRVEYVSDRVNTTSTAFMALTAGCAKCHDHKFDPLSQKEYYQMFSFFNNVKEAGQISWDDAMPVPTMLITDGEKEKILSFLRSTEQQKNKELDAIVAAEEPAFAKWLQSGTYRNANKNKFPHSLIGHFPLNDALLKNTVAPFARASMKREGGTKESPFIVNVDKGKALQFDGDTWLDLVNIGKFSRSDAFSVGLWVTIPKEVKSGVIFHQGTAGLLYNFRGFHLALENNRLQLVMAHTAPYNAIIEYSKEDVPHDQWIHLCITYDGASKADGYKLYLNGSEMPTLVDQDNLYKDIVFPPNMQPALQFGAWERGKGLINGKAKDITVFSRDLCAMEVRHLANPQANTAILNKTPDQLTIADKEALRDLYFASYSFKVGQAKSQIRQVRKNYSDSVEKVRELMIMQEMPQARKAYVLDRGEYNVYKEEVMADVPKSVLPMPVSFPRNRLGFAQWLVHPDHPLTARVTVNRYWQLYFGKGLVKTTEDFGNQGDLPSHPQLLDWLAVSFRESGWNIKALQKMIVMSATYRQSSKPSEKATSVDPENILLSHAPANRLTAEMLRDNALAASSLINLKIGGPSVYPYQPEGLWRINGSEYKQDTGSNLYRRSLYTVWRRSAPNPTQATFDVGIRTSCIVGRQKTNTPLQALVTLNDPTFVEAAKVIGEQITEATNVQQGIIDAFRKLTGRRPSGKELALLLELREKEYRKFKQENKKTKGWLTTGEYKIKSSLDAAQVAANAVVANTIINTDAVITKR